MKDMEMGYNVNKMKARAEELLEGYQDLDFDS